MPRITPFTPDERAAALAELSAWTYRDKGFFRSIKLGTFSQAFALMTRIALEAEKADHHPEWFNVYNRIDIRLTTHDAGDVSMRDLALARLIDRFALEAGSPASEV